MAVNKSSASYKRAAKNFRKDIEKKERLFREIQSSAGKDEMEEVVELIGDEALRLTPEDTGQLKESQYRRTEVSQDMITGIIGYSDDKAIYVHEADNYHAAPTQRKFLDTAVQNKTKEALEILEGVTKPLEKAYSGKTKL